MPITYDDRPINLELLAAIDTNNPDMVKEKLKSGANPFANVHTPNGNKNILLHTLTMGRRKALVALLNHTKQPGKRIIDLSESIPCDDRQNREPMNIIQFAYLGSSSGCRAVLKSYYEEQTTTKSYKAVLNQQFYYKHKDGKYHLTTLGHALLEHWSTQLFFENSAILNQNKPAKAEIEEALVHWLGHKEPNSSPPDEIEFHGPTSQLKELIQDGYDVLATNHRGSVIDVVTKMEASQSDATKFTTDILPHLIFRGIKLTGAASTISRNDRKMLSMPAQFFTLFDTNPFEATLTLDFTKLKKCLTAAAEAQRSAAALAHVPELVFMHRRLSDLDKRVSAVEQRLDELCTDFASTAAGQKVEARKKLAAYPFYLDTFDELYANIESLIRQTRDAKLKVFATNPPREYRAAYTVLSVFNFAAQASPVCPLAITVIPSLLAVMLNMKSELDQARRSGAVFDATLKIEPASMATLVAALLIAEAMQTHGANPSAEVRANLAKELFATVEAQIKRMHTETFHNPEDAIVYLCDTAIRKLRLQRYSSGSTSSDGPRLALTGGSATPTKKATPPAPAYVPKATSKKKAGGACVVM